MRYDHILCIILSICLSFHVKLIRFGILQLCSGFTFYFSVSIWEIQLCRIQFLVTKNILLCKVKFMLRLYLTFFYKHILNFLWMSIPCNLHVTLFGFSANSAWCWGPWKNRLQLSYSRGYGGFASQWCQNERGEIYFM